MTQEELLATLEVCGQKLAIVRAALIDCEFENLASVIEQVDGELEEVYYTIKQEAEQHD